jgi:hypothetical protein
MPYRIEEITESAIRRGILGGCIDLVVSWRLRITSVPAEQIAVITSTSVRLDDRMLRMSFLPKQSEWLRFWLYMMNGWVSRSTMS